MPLIHAGRAPALRAACIAASLALSACASHAVMAPASAPGPDAKPALATPPPSVMTPQGY